MSGLGKRQSSVKSATLLLLGVDEPFEYEGGTFVARDGQTVSFPAGTSTRICVGSPDLMDFAEFKVKGKVFPTVWPVIEHLGRGVLIDVKYREYDGQPGEVVSITLAMEGDFDPSDLLDSAATR